MDNVGPSLVHQRNAIPVAFRCRDNNGPLCLLSWRLKLEKSKIKKKKKKKNNDETLDLNPPPPLTKFSGSAHALLSKVPISVCQSDDFNGDTARFLHTIYPVMFKASAGFYRWLMHKPGTAMTGRSFTCS